MILKRSEVKEQFNCIGVSYCDLQNLLSKFNKTGVIVGSLGWRADVYHVNLSNWAIVTGYEPINNIPISDTKKRAIIDKYNKLALNQKIDYNNKKGWQEPYIKLLNRFIKEIQKNCKW